MYEDLNLLQASSDIPLRVLVALFLVEYASFYIYQPLYYPCQKKSQKDN